MASWKERCPVRYPSIDCAFRVSGSRQIHHPPPNNTHTFTIFHLSSTDTAIVTDSDSDTRWHLGRKAVPSGIPVSIARSVFLTPGKFTPHPPHLHNLSSFFGSIVTDTRWHLGRKAVPSGIPVSIARSVCLTPGKFTTHP